MGILAQRGGRTRSELTECASSGNDCTFLITNCTYLAISQGPNKGHTDSVHFSSFAM